MKPQLSTCLGLFVASLAFLAGGCQPSSPTVPSGHQTQESLLVRVDTNTQIEREGWKDYQPVGFGALVSPTDLLKTDGEITFLCADLKTVKTLTGQGSCPCKLPQEAVVLTYDDMLFTSGVRGNLASTIPSLISPRNTTILDTRPLLRWKDTGAASYTIEIRQGSQTVWSITDASGIGIAYPADAPMLLADKDYLLVVTDNTTGRSSSEDNEKGLGFQVASNMQRAKIDAQRRSILNLAGLDEPSKKLALAIYYIHLRIGGRGLWNDARILLEEVAQAKPNESVISLRLGNVLAKMKLWDEAYAAYDTARIQAEKLKDMETQADALAALWRIDPSQTQYGDAAITYYGQIGADEKAEALNKEMKP